MSEYVVALIGVVVLLITGWAFFGLAANETIKKNAIPLDMPRIIQAAVGMYIASLALVVLYNGFDFASGVQGALKGLYLGLLVGIPFWAIPFFADSGYLKGDSKAVMPVLLNWVVAFAVLGLVIGLLIG